MTAEEFTAPGIILGFILWIGVLWCVRAPLRHKKPMDIGVRAAFIVTFVGLLASLCLSNILVRLPGPEDTEHRTDLTNISIFMTRAVVIAGAVYAYIAIYLAHRRGRVGGPL